MLFHSVCSLGSVEDFAPRPCVSSFRRTAFGKAVEGFTVYSSKNCFSARPDLEMSGHP